ncbi:MAG TPA: alpha/beta hydrolase [Planktothrix sp.]
MQNREGVVYIIDGAGGSGWTPLVFRRSLSGLPYEVKHFRWGTGYMRIINDLTDRENIESRSNELRQSIEAHKREHPHERIYVIAKSAGTMIALRALSDLPQHTVEKAILLSPAVSPGFDLSNALRACKQELINFWSPNDHFFLNLGTSLFGTADGIKGKGAGLVGFDIPKESVEEYAKLRQIKWEPSMMKLLHMGDHAGNSMPPFVDKHIVPLLHPGEYRQQAPQAG